MLRALYIVKLAGLDRPKEDEPAGQADKEHKNDESNDRPEHTTTFVDRITGYNSDTFMQRSMILDSSINPDILSGLLATLHYLILSEFITTVTELTAIAAAATIGFKRPAMASGTAATL